MRVAKTLDLDAEKNFPYILSAKQQVVHPLLRTQKDKKVQKQSQYKKPNQIQEGSNDLTELSEQELQSVVGGQTGQTLTGLPFLYYYYPNGRGRYALS